MIAGRTNVTRSHRLAEATIVACRRSCGSVSSPTIPREVDSATQADELAIVQRGGVHVARDGRVAAQARGASPMWVSLQGIPILEDQDIRTRSSDYATKQSVRQTRGGLVPETALG